MAITGCNVHPFEASTSHGLTWPVVKVVIHALLFDEVMRAAATRDLEQAQRGAANEFVLNQGPVVKGVARETAVTPAELTYDSTAYSYIEPVIIQFTVSKRTNDPMYTTDFQT